MRITYDREVDARYLSFKVSMKGGADKLDTSLMSQPCPILR